MSYGSNAKIDGNNSIKSLKPFPNSNIIKIT